MTKVMLDKQTISKLSNLTEAIELCDESGKTLGHFLPEVDKEVYKRIQIPISEEELSRREKEGGGRTLDQILGDLERMS